jgi:hypothetical protein
MSKSKKISVDRSELADDQRKLVDDVQRDGWHVVGADEKKRGPSFAYSVGLSHSYDHPEVMICGLAAPTMIQLINTVGERIRNGQKFEEHFEDGDILEDHLLYFLPVDRQHYSEHLGCARWFYEGEDFPVLQCVWPDPKGRYPWHPKFTAKLKKKQPLLGERGPWPFLEGKNRPAFTTRQVMEGHPIMLVLRDKKGNWQFLCGTTDDQRDGQMVGLETLLNHDPTVADLADMQPGSEALRESADSPWIRYKVGK